MGEASLRGISRPTPGDTGTGEGPAASTLCQEVTVGPHLRSSPRGIENGSGQERRAMSSELLQLVGGRTRI